MAISTSTGIVGYLALFAGVGFLFVFVNLLIGRFVRPRNPHAKKVEIYECGEPSIGSSFVQFDLRFYVVALIFIVFDVEVAFLFPWATVFGKSIHLSRLADQHTPEAEHAVRGLEKELGLPSGAAGPVDMEATGAGAAALAKLAAIEVSVFFGILLVGYIYVWGTGALDWIRSMPAESVARPLGSPVRAIGGRPPQPALSA